MEELLLTLLLMCLLAAGVALAVVWRVVRWVRRSPQLRRRVRSVQALTTPPGSRRQVACLRDLHAAALATGEAVAVVRRPAAPSATCPSWPGGWAGWPGPSTPSCGCWPTSPTRPSWPGSCPRPGPGRGRHPGRPDHPARRQRRPRGRHRRRARPPRGRGRPRGPGPRRRGRPPPHPRLRRLTRADGFARPSTASGYTLNRMWTTSPSWTT